MKDGGPAFPIPMFQRQYDGQPMSAIEFFEGGGGMSLRDWFAGMAIASVSFSTMQRSSINEIAKHSYALADAMLAARERKEDA